MNYKELLRHKLATRIIQQISEEGRSKFTKRVSSVSEQKRKEIVVWMRLQKGKDKDQIKDFAKSKFNISDEDSEKLFFEAFPDGVDFEEESILDCLNDILNAYSGFKVPELVSILDIPSTYMTDEIANAVGIDPLIAKQIRLVYNTLLMRRKII